MSAPFDVADVHIQIEFLTSCHDHFDFCLNEKSDLWHLCGERGGGDSAGRYASLTLSLMLCVPFLRL